MFKKFIAIIFSFIDKHTNTLILLLLVLAIFSPYVLTLETFTNIDFSETGPIGDTIGGLTAPFINLLAALLVYKSFREQLNANEILSRETNYNYIRNLREDVFESFKTFESGILVNMASKVINTHQYVFTKKDPVKDRDFSINSYETIKELLESIIFLIAEIDRTLKPSQQQFYYYKIELLLKPLNLFLTLNTDEFNTTEALQKHPNKRKDIKILMDIRKQVSLIYLKINPDKLNINPF